MTQDTHFQQFLPNSLASTDTFEVSRLSLSRVNSHASKSSNDQIVLAVDNKFSLLPSIPLLKLNAEQFIQQRVANKITHLNIYGPDYIEAITERKDTISIDRVRGALPVFSDVNQLKAYLKRVDLEVAQSSQEEYTVTARERSSVRMREEPLSIIQKPLKEAEKKRFKSYQKITGNKQLNLLDSALCYFVCRVHDPGEVERLLVAGANPNVEDRNFGPLLPHAITTSLFFEANLSEQYYKDSYAITKLLIRAKASLKHYVDPYGSLLFQVFAEGEDEELALLMIDMGADIHVMHPKSKNTLLSITIERGWTVSASVLLKKRLDPNSKDDVYGTVLHYACSKENKTIAHALIYAGADVNKINFDGSSVIDVMVERRNLDTETLKILLQKKISKKLLDRGLQKLCEKNQWNRRNEKQLSRLLNAGANLDAFIHKKIIHSLPRHIRCMLDMNSSILFDRLNDC